MGAPSVFDLKRATLFIVDGTGTPNELEVLLDEGTLKWTHAKNIEYRLNRGKLDTVREGDQVPMEVTIDARYNALRSDSGDPVTVYEALTQTGAAASWESSDAAGVCTPYAVDLKLEVDQDCTDVKDELYTFPDFRPEKIDVDPKTGMMNISGKCNAVHPTVIRTTLS